MSPDATTSTDSTNGNMANAGTGTLLGAHAETNSATQGPLLRV